MTFKVSCSIDWVRSVECEHIGTTAGAACSAMPTHRPAKGKRRRKKNQKSLPKVGQRRKDKHLDLKKYWSDCRKDPPPLEEYDSFNDPHMQSFYRRKLGHFDKKSTRATRLMEKAGVFKLFGVEMEYEEFQQWNGRLHALKHGKIGEHGDIGLFDPALHGHLVKRRSKGPKQKSAKQNTRKLQTLEHRHQASVDSFDSWLESQDREKQDVVNAALQKAPASPSPAGAALRGKWHAQVGQYLFNDEKHRRTRRTPGQPDASYATPYTQVEQVPRHPKQKRKPAQKKHAQSRRLAKARRAQEDAEARATLARRRKEKQDALDGARTGTGHASHEESHRQNSVKAWDLCRMYETSSETPSAAWKYRGASAEKEAELRPVYDQAALIIQKHVRGHLVLQGAKRRAISAVESAAERALQTGKDLLEGLNKSTLFEQARLAWALSTPGQVRSIHVERASVNQSLGVDAVLPPQLEFKFMGQTPIPLSDAYLHVNTVKVRAV